jgi:protein-S-isoprenylcysteine O-methyltransferase Ste14
MIALHWFLPLALIYNWFLFSIGLVIIIFGLVMSFRAEGQFRKHETTVDHLGNSAKLVIDGWYQYSRNPMYLSLLVLLVGVWLSLGSLSPLVIIPIFIFLTERWYIKQEEIRLLAIFGKEYVSYQKRTRRWI